MARELASAEMMVLNQAVVVVDCSNNDAVAVAAVAAAVGQVAAAEAAPVGMGGAVRCGQPRQAGGGPN